MRFFNIFIVTLTAFLGVSSLASAAPEPGTYHTYKMPPFFYFYAGKDPGVVEDLDKEIRQLIPEMELRLGTRLPDTIEVGLPISRDEFAWLTQGKVPDWAGGVAYPGEDRIVIKTPLFFGEGVSLPVLMAHELAHLLIDAASRGNGVPKWFNEGLSQILAGESRTGYSTRLARAALANRLIGLPRVDGVLGYSRQDADLAYAESHAATQALVERFDWEAIRNILFIVGSGAEFDEAFLQATGLEYEAWQAEWLESAQKRYRGYAFLETDTIIWLLIILLSSVAVVVAWIRKRKQMQRWQDEEEAELINESKNSKEEE